MEYGKLKKQGSVLVEVMVGILIFSVGLLALAGSMTFSLRGIAASGEHLILRQTLFNNVDSYLLRRSAKHDNKAADAGAAFVQNGQFTISGDAIPFNIYKFTQPEKDDYSLYVAEGVD